MSSKTLSYPKSKINILLLENVDASAVQRFRDEGFSVQTYSKLSGPELLALIPEVHVLGIRSKTIVTQEVLDAAKKLLCVGAFCIGTDQIDLDHAASRGVAVFNAPFANTRSVAEVVMSNVVALARGIGDDNVRMHQGIWLKSAKGKHEVRGKILGIVGYGHVGSQLSILAEAFGMRVMYYDILSKLPLGNATPAESLQELLEQADFVSLHVPFTEQTKNMIDAQAIAKMKPGAFLINYARGKCVDVVEVAKALREKRLAGAAFDVFPEEPNQAGESFVSPLIGAPNTILTPHIGGSTEEAQESIGREVAQKLISFINSGSTISAVNFPEVDLPPNPRVHRVLNIHRNVPGVLRDINNLLSPHNISAQMLGTRGSIGYFMCHLDSEASVEVKNKLKELPNSIKTRVLF